MKNYKHILIILVCCLLAGCFSNKYIERKQYLLEPPKAVAKKTDHHSCSVFVEPMAAIAPFDQLDFLYRIGNERYLIDYYNGFLAPASGQLDSILRVYFKDHAKFNLDIADISRSNYQLQTKLVEMYADYRDHNNPKAVVAIQFVLSDTAKDKAVILLDKVFRSNISLRAKTTNELLRAWNIGVASLLRNGVQILNRKVGC